jgi:branched-chain amino acid transport system permease protein
VTRRALRWLALGGAALALPLVVRNPFFLHLCILVAMWTLLGAAWNVLGGFAGQVSFGHASLFGIGAYVTIILYLQAGLPPWWGIPLAGAAAAVTSLPIGLLTFRLRGPYFSLSTLAVAEIVRLLALNWEEVTRGPEGMLITSLPEVRLGGRAVDWEAKEPFYLVIAALAVLGLAATDGLRRSRLGAFLVAIREDEDAAEAVGIDTVRAKVLTLALSAFLAGAAGGFYAFYFRYVDPDAVLGIALSMEMVFIAIVGGLGTVGGPLIGAVFLITIAETVRSRFQVGHLIFYGLFMMLVIRYMPEGIWGRLTRLAARRAGSGTAAAGGLDGPARG